MSARPVNIRRRLLLALPAFTAGAALTGCADAPRRAARLDDPGTNPTRQHTATAMSALQPDRQQALDRALERIVNAEGRALASLAVAAIADGRVVYQRAFGRAWIDPAGRGEDVWATPDTLYRIASISKLFVALAAGELVAAGRLDPERDISDYLGFTLRNPHHPARPITLAMLFSHTSSLRDAGGYNFPETVALADVLLPAGSRYQGAVWAREWVPGAFFSYCNLGFGLAAQVMEAATGERFDRLMQRVLFAPLGVTATFDPSALAATDLARVATLYRKRAAGDGDLKWNPGGPWVPQVDDYRHAAPKPRASDAYRAGRNGSVFGPQGGLRISVAALARIMTVILNGGRDDRGRPLLAPAALATVFNERWRFVASRPDGTGNRAEDDEGEGGLFNAWGFGPQRFLDLSSSRRGDRFVEGGGLAGWGHLGNAYGLTSAFVFDPDRRHGFVFTAGGTAFDPDSERGQYSAHYRYEEQIATAVFRHALA